MWVYESVVSPTLKQVSQEARKVPALQKALDKLDAFTVRCQGLGFCSPCVFPSTVSIAFSLDQPGLKGPGLAVAFGPCPVLACNHSCSAVHVFGRHEPPNKSQQE